METKPDHPASDAVEAALSGFSTATRTWFTDVFEQPTAVQVSAWQAISSGSNALVVAPTGSGKTLAAFLHSLDHLARDSSAQQALMPNSDHHGQAASQEIPAGQDVLPGTPPGVQLSTTKRNAKKSASDKGVMVLYISPLKALAVDVERNLRAPLRGIAATAERLGLPVPQVSVAVRSGDTPASERRRMETHPPDILITTPESLFLMLSSKVGSILRDISTVIIDEVHVLAGTKRGAHLMLSLERLNAANRRGGFQRIGLSATVRPTERVATFLSGNRPIQIIKPPAQKDSTVQVIVPVEDMTQLHSTAPAESGDPGAPRLSMWPPIERQILDLITTHRSTICFVNSRQVAERLTAHLNELYAQDHGAQDSPAPLPAQVMTASASTQGHDGNDDFGVIARAHHGSVSKQQRALVEADLKAGRLPCVVATSSLELGIDMGAVDLVIQVQTPPSVSSGLQRVGRAGHHVGAVSQGVLFPTSRGDVLESAVVSSRMAAGAIESVHQLRNPLDVLAQQLVSMCLDGPHAADDLFQIVRASTPFAQLPRSAFDSVLDMLSGRYPSEDFAELRPRLVWDRASGQLSARPGARRLVTTSGGTIPDRGLYGVFLVGEDDSTGRNGPGRRVGELDEEMVYESRVGDVFTLGTSSWRIEEITPSQVIVSPAPGHPGRLPFWRGDSPGRPAELGQAIAAEIGKLAGMDPEQASELVMDQGLNSYAADNLLSYLADQREATGVLPDDHTIVVERFRDEIGDWRVCVHCPLGTKVLSPWALLIEQQARGRYGMDVHVTATNDGLIIQLPDVDAGAPDASLLVVPAEDVERQVTELVYGSALFAARFRECSARALLLPRRNPGQRSPLWQQRIKSAQLLEVASGYQEFPIIVEAMRECLEDIFDLPALVRLMADIASRTVRLVEVETPQASPFARNLLFGYVGEFVYDTDQPLAERRLSALTLDSGLLAELLGKDGAQQILDDQVAAQIEAELQFIDPDHQARTAEQLWEIIRSAGPFTDQECRARSVHDPADWLHELAQNHRIAQVRIAGTPMWCVENDIGMLRDALGVPVPAGMNAPEPRDDGAALRDLVLRWTRRHAITTVQAMAERFGLGAPALTAACEALTEAGTLIAGQLFGPEVAQSTQLTQPDQLTQSAQIAQPEQLTEPGQIAEPRQLAGLVGPLDAQQYCHHRVLTLMKRRTLANLRAQVEAVDQRQYARFLDAWQQLPTESTAHDASGEPGIDDLLAAADILAGYRIPASMLESVVLPARIPGYRAALLDEALATGELSWQGAGAIGTQDGWVRLWPADLSPAPVRLDGNDDRHLSAVAERIYQRLEAGGAWRVTDLADDQTSPSALNDGLWELAWAGLATTDTFAPVRQLCSQGSLKKPARPRARRRPMRPRAPRQTSPVAGAGTRWAAISLSEGKMPAGTLPADDPAMIITAIDLELNRYGVLTRAGVLAEDATPVFTPAYQVLTRMEETGAVRRGYFVDGLGGAQFAVPGAVDRLRDAPAAPARLLAACDPANPYGASLEWPPTNGHRPTRKAGALVVLDDGYPVCYVERGARTLVSFHDTTEAQLEMALRMMGQAIDSGALAAVSIERIDGRDALDHRDLAPVFAKAGFAMVPRGFKRRAVLH